MSNKECFSQFAVKHHFISSLKSDDFYKRYKAYRNAAGNFTSKKSVRNYFLSKNSKCALCGSKEKLTLDHIIDVYSCARGKASVKCLNCIKNIRVLCSSCNSQLMPGRYNVNSDTRLCELEVIV